MGVLAAELHRSSWFARCGAALDASERAEIEHYLRTLDLPAFAIEGVACWEAAGTTAQRPDWSREWWDAEAREAERLKDAAITLQGEVPVLEALSELTGAAATLHEPAARAARQAGVEDEALIRAASGAAAIAAHQMGLALAAEAGPGHPLARKFRLFAGGRWLLGVMGQRCYLF